MIPYQIVLEVRSDWTEIRLLGGALFVLDQGFIANFMTHVNIRLTPTLLSFRGVHMISLGMLGSITIATPNNDLFINGTISKGDLGFVRMDYGPSHALNDQIIDHNTNMINFNLDLSVPPLLEVSDAVRD